MYGVNVPAGLDRRIAKLERDVALLMKESQERVEAEKESTTFQITEEVKIKPKSPKKTTSKKKEKVEVKNSVTEDSTDSAWGDPTITLE